MDNSDSRLHGCSLVQGTATQTFMKQSCHSPVINIRKREVFCHSAPEVIYIKKLDSNMSKTCSAWCKVSSKGGGLRNDSCVSRRGVQGLRSSAPHSNHCKSA